MTKSPDAKQFPTITALLERIAVALEANVVTKPTPKAKKDK